MIISNLLINGRTQPFFSWLWLCTFFLLWNYLAVGQLSLSSIFFISSLLIMSVIAGDIFVNWLLKDLVQFSNAITKMLLGLISMNFIMLFLSYFSPFGLALDWFFLILAVGFLWALSGWRKRVKIILFKENTETFFLIFSPVAITGWTQDLLRPIEIVNGMGVIRAWPDIYYHLSQIRVFASSMGASTISDVMAAGAPTHIYHMASYLLPATLSSFTGLTTLEAYSSLYLPMGLLLTALAAYAFINSIFGKWPALFSSIGLLLLPDAFQQGFGNPFLSYHWMQQIGPAGLYGVAAAAIAFMFLFESCRNNSIKFLILAYVFTFATLLYKAQIFVAISLLALIFPALFFKNISLTLRTIGLFILSVLFFYVVSLSQSITAVPTIRFDGSGFSEYVSIIFGLQLDGFIKVLVTPAFSGAGDYSPFKFIVFLVMLVLCTFGAYVFFYIVVLVRMRHWFRPHVMLFPLLVIANYLFMATFLAMDGRNVGSREELLHRPFIWAYFVVITWSIAGCYHLFIANRLPLSRYLKTALFIPVICLLFIPVKLGEGISTIKEFKMNYQEIPICQLEVANFIKNNGKKSEIIQDSRNDPKFLLSALSDRPIFVIDSGGYRMPVDIQNRLSLAASMRTVKDLDQIQLIMKNNSITWYVVSPGNDVEWKFAAEKLKVYECGNYSIFKFN